MPEYVLAAGISVMMGLFGLSFRKIDTADRRMDRLELKVAENNVTKEEFREQFKALFVTLARLEDKIDAHISEDTGKIESIKRKYRL